MLYLVILMRCGLKFSDITFSVPSQLPQSLAHLKNKVATFFSKQPGGNFGMSFKEIDKVQIKATCMPIANAFVTQKAPSDTPHDDDLDQFKNLK